MNDAAAYEETSGNSKDYLVNLSSVHFYKFDGLRVSPSMLRASRVRRRFW